MMFKAAVLVAVSPLNGNKKSVCVCILQLQGQFCEVVGPGHAALLQDGGGAPQRGESNRKRVTTVKTHRTEFLRARGVIIPPKYTAVCVCVSGVGHGAAEPGEQTADWLSRQRAASLGHQLPAGGEEGGRKGRREEGKEGRREGDGGSVASTRFLSLPQERAEGEPKVKKGKSLLDDSDEEEAEEGGDESVDDVRR